MKNRSAGPQRWRPTRRRHDIPEQPGLRGPGLRGPAVAVPAAQAQKWGTIKGQVVYAEKGKAPRQPQGQRGQGQGGLPGQGPDPQGRADRRSQDQGRQERGLLAGERRRSGQGDPGEPQGEGGPGQGGGDRPAVLRLRAAHRAGGRRAGPGRQEQRRHRPQHQDRRRRDGAEHQPRDAAQVQDRGGQDQAPHLCHPVLVQHPRLDEGLPHRRAQPLCRGVGGGRDVHDQGCAGGQVHAGWAGTRRAAGSWRTPRRRRGRAGSSRSRPTASRTWARSSSRFPRDDE